MSAPDGGVIPVPSPGTTRWFGAPGEPLVVVVHDWYGRLPAVLDYCTALASHGFRVAAPDLYDGVGTTDPASAEELLAALEPQDAHDRIDECVAAADGTRVAMVGFAIGGRLALLHAQSGAVDAAVAYCATLGPESAAVLPCPVLLHFAEVDEWEDDEDPDSFVARLRDHGTPVERHDYPGTAHSFPNAAIPEAHDARAAALAFARTASFLRRELLD